MKNLNRLLSYICLLALVVCLARAAEVLPERLSDREFWKLIVDSSEPTQQFPGDNLVSNETKYLSVVRALQQSVSPGGVYLGVGPEQNFTYIAMQVTARSWLSISAGIRIQKRVDSVCNSPGRREFV
jgi:hypothetical protein